MHKRGIIGAVPHKTAWEEFQELYPVGAVVKTLAKIEEPIKNKDLPAGSLVTIKEVQMRDSAQSFQMIKASKVWILCEDKNKELWNIRPHYLEKYSAPTGKRGRFRILAQDAAMEKHNKDWDEAFAKQNKEDLSCPKK
jgi:hypothetical protein